jgi:Bacterial Ig domain
VDAGTWTSSANTANWSVTIDSTAYADGGHAVSAMATDSVGHASTASVSVTFGNSPPSVSIASPQAGATVSGTLSVSGSSSSLAGIASVQVQVDANPAVTATGTTSWSATIDTTAFSNGGHAITATATDSKGRSTSTSVSVTVSNLLATHQNPWYLKDNTGNVSTVNETMTWDGDTNQNSKLPTGNVIFDVNSTIQPNDANSLDTCTQSASTGFWTCVHPIQAADLQWSFVLGWSLHYAFQLQVEYPPTSTFTISYSGDSNFFPSSAQAINT